MTGMKVEVYGFASWVTTFIAYGEKQLNFVLFKINWNRDVFTVGLLTRRCFTSVRNQLLSQQVRIILITHHIHNSSDIGQ